MDCVNNNIKFSLLVWQFHLIISLIFQFLDYAYVNILPTGGEFLSSSKMCTKTIAAVPLLFQNGKTINCFEESYTYNENCRNCDMKLPSAHKRNYTPSLSGYKNSGD